MVRQRRISGAAAVALSVGTLTICTAASYPQAPATPSGGAQAPDPGVPTNCARSFVEWFPVANLPRQSPSNNRLVGRNSAE